MEDSVPLLLESSSVDGNLPEFPPKTSSRHLRDLHILSFTFLFIFTAYTATQNLESSLNSDEDLGTTSLAILYLSYTVCSFVATPFVKRFGSKNAVILGTSGYWLFIASNLFPSWYTMIPASLYLGFTASIIWVGEGTYLTLAARSHAAECNLPEGTVLGNFNGEFWGISACAQVIGNLLSLSLLKTETEGKSSGTTLLFIVFLGSMSLGTILGFFLSKQNGTKTRLLVQMSNGSHSSFGDSLKATFVPLLDKRMLLLIPLLVYSGLEQPFVFAAFTKDVVVPAIGVSGVGGAMTVFGVADAIFSILVGRLTTGLLSITFIMLGGIFLHAIVLFRLCLNHSFGSGTLDLINIIGMTALWGLGDGVFMTQINAVLGILFPHDTEASFSQLKIWHSGATAVAFFVSSRITFVAMLAVLAVTLFISLVGVIALYWETTVTERC